MAESPQHATLTAATVATFTLSAQYQRVEVYSVDGAAALYFTVDGTTPVAAATGTYVIGAAIQAVEVAAPTPAAGASTVVKVISAGTPKVSVRGV